MYSRILNHVRKELLPDIANEMRSGDEDMSVAEKMRLWGINAVTERFQPDDDQESREDYQDENDDDDDNTHSTILAGYTDLRAFLLESEEYRWLLCQLEQVGYVDGDNVLRRVTGALAARPSRIGTNRSMSLCLPWQPRDFMHQQYGNADVVALLGNVITISGSHDNAFASTCEAYILQTWPKYGPFVLESIERAIASTQKTSQEVTDSLSLRVSLYADCTTIDIVGDPLFLVETAEIMVWLSIACRASVTGDEIQIGRMDLQQVTDYWNDVSFVGELTLEDATTIGNEGMSHATCWHGMFRNPVIAHGYPIPSRSSQEQGLELSIEMMLMLAQAFYGVVYCGVLMLKGFSTLLTPTRKENGSVTWHFIFNKTGARQSYNDGLQHSCLRTLDDAIFDGARHFVGWSGSAEFLTGEYAFAKVRRRTPVRTQPSNCQGNHHVPIVLPQDSDTSSANAATESDALCKRLSLMLTSPGGAAYGH